MIMGRQQTLLKDKEGNINGVNANRLYEYPFWLLTNPPNNIVTIPRSQSAQPVQLVASGNGPAEILSFSHSKTRPCRVLLSMNDGATQRTLMNSGIHIDTIFGNAQNPYYLPQALVVPQGRSLSAVFTDLSTDVNDTDNQVRIAALTGRYTFPELEPDIPATRGALALPYWYGVDNGFITLAANQSVETTISIADDFSFQLITLSAVSSYAFDVNIIDSTTGEPLIDAPQSETLQVSSNLLFGNAGFPFKFHEPRLLSRGQKLRVLLTNRYALENTIWLTLGGRALLAA